MYELEKLSSPVQITEFLGSALTWSKSPPSKSVSYSKSENLLVTYTLSLMLISLVSYNVWQLYKRKRDLIREMMRGPNKLILTNTDLDFTVENTETSGRKEKTKTGANKGENNQGHSQKMLSSDQKKLSDKKDSNEKMDPQKKRRKKRSKMKGNIARLIDETVWVKKINKIELKKQTQNELRHLRELRHDNLNRFCGFYSDINSCGLISIYCQRSSLFDLLQKKEYTLDWTFKSSLLLDLVRGMNYIHKSSIKFHGKLKSTNCVVDGRFTLKVTDYGLHLIKQSQKLEFLDEKEEVNKSEDLLWTAPEILKLKDKESDESQNINKNKKLSDQEKLEVAENKKFNINIFGSQKSDIYSFGIIGSEICTREAPFGMYKPKYSNSYIIKRVKKCPPIFRPLLKLQDCPVRMKELLKLCWSQSLELRPDFGTIETTIQSLLEDKKANIVDNMMKVLEEYSNHLEDIVAERTAELEVEKKKSEELLCRMLPPSVATRLTAGEVIPPESFSISTIYFSDICGFTTISAASSPLEVVDLLNDLYTMFDTIIDSYEVYKVETIGDAYMVSSGIPKRIGERHAAEIALMSLDILSAVGSFVMRHLPRVPMRIRIGLHSGPAVSGIVGKKMPRYCLFGDTINTASRMESTGLPQRIHISPTTYEYLLRRVDLLIGVELAFLFFFLG